MSHRGIEGMPKCLKNNETYRIQWEALSFSKIFFILSTDSVLPLYLVAIQTMPNAPPQQPFKNGAPKSSLLQRCQSFWTYKNNLTSEIVFVVVLVFFKTDLLDPQLFQDDYSSNNPNCAFFSTYIISNTES